MYVACVLCCCLNNVILNDYIKKLFINKNLKTHKTTIILNNYAYIYGIWCTDIYKLPVGFLEISLVYWEIVPFSLLLFLFFFFFFSHCFPFIRLIVVFLFLFLHWEYILCISSFQNFVLISLMVYIRHSYKWVSLLICE